MPIYQNTQNEKWGANDHGRDHPVAHVQGVPALPLGPLGRAGSGEKRRLRRRRGERPRTPIRFAQRKTNYSNFVPHKDAQPDHVATPARTVMLSGGSGEFGWASHGQYARADCDRVQHTSEEAYLSWSCNMARAVKLDPPGKDPIQAARQHWLKGTWLRAHPHTLQRSRDQVSTRLLQRAAEVGAPKTKMPEHMCFMPTHMSAETPRMSTRMSTHMSTTTSPDKAFRSAQRRYRAASGKCSSACLNVCVGTCHALTHVQTHV